MLLATQDQGLDAGAVNAAAATQRTCALTRRVLPVDRLLRFVVSPAGDVVADVKRKLPGRGMWISATQAALAEAVAHKVFARTFRRDVRVDADLVAKTERLLARSALDALAIAAKSNKVVAGFTKVEAALKCAGAVALIHASDGSADGMRKLSAVLYRETAGKPGGIAIVEEFSGAQLDLALGHPNVVHAALLAGPVSGTVLVRAMRLQRFRTRQSPD
jgi:predicted RNA-binding protein YlxR (DUF448 family)